jgi:hypothetical protein
MDMSSCIVLAALIALHLGRLHHEAFVVLAAVEVLLLCLRSLYFCMVRACTMCTITSQQGSCAIDLELFQTNECTNAYGWWVHAMGLGRARECVLPAPSCIMLLQQPALLCLPVRPWTR